MRPLLTAVIFAALLFGATRLGEAENFNPGYHLLEGYGGIYVSYPSDPCMVAGQGSTVVILDKSHICDGGGGGGN